MAVNNNIEPKPAVAANPTEATGSPAEAMRQSGDEAGNMSPTKLDNLRQMMSERYPDDDLSNDDDFYARIADDYANSDKELEGYRDRESKIGSLFAKNPRSAEFMKTWIDGGDPDVEYIRRFGKESYTAALDDPEKLDEIAKANEEYLSQVKEGQALEEEYKKNLEQSLNDIDSYQTTNGLSDEQIDQAMTWLKDIAYDIVMGKFTPDVIAMAAKAQNYDKDIANAAEEGEIRGKNSKVDMKLRKPEKGDAMPQLGSRSGGAGGGMRQIPGALGRDKRSIWDAGAEKRTSR